MDMKNSDRNVNEAYMHGVMTDIKRLMVHKKVSRDELCDFIKEKTGKRVTVSTVDAWFKESRPDRVITESGVWGDCKKAAYLVDW
jgi:hypothetical protein